MLFLVVSSVHAQAPVIGFDGTAGTVIPDDFFDVRIILNPGDTTVNAFAVDVKYDEKIFMLDSIRDGSSIVGVWIEKKNNQKDGSVHLEGIMPGGFSGTLIPNTEGRQSGLIALLHFKALQEGDTSLKITNARVCAHDGDGTEISLSEIAYDVTVSKKEGAASALGTYADATPPEAFSVSVLKRKAEFDGKRVAVFSTQDMDSGVSHYEARQTIRTLFIPFPAQWKTVESPLVLAHQLFPSRIEIKAVDFNGNERVASAQYPDRPLGFFEYGDVALLTCLLAVLILCIVLKYVRL